MIPDTNVDELLVALSKEVVKLYRIFDGSNRVITSYETFANTADGGVALKTEYTYDGATTNVEKLKESIDVWSAAYEI